MNIYPEDNDVIFDGEDDDDLEEDSRQLTLAGKLLILILVLALVTTLIWPLLQTRYGYHPTPTPTPLFLQEA